MKVFIVILVFVTICLLLISNSTNLKNNLLRSSRFSCSFCSMLFPALEIKDKYIGIEEGEREREAEKKMERESEVKASKFKRICVYCGSSQGKKDIYREAAIELGKVMVSKNIDLVYGGGSVGLMGLVSHAVHDGGRHVLGVIPKTLMARELTGKTVGEVKVVADMHQRKSEMAKLSDAFIALPGGYGTFEEILEVITWAQLGIHDKPVGLLNVDGFYDPLLSFIDKGIEDGFISPVDRHIIVSAPTAKDLIEKLEEYVPRDNGIASRLKWEKDQQAHSKNCNCNSSS